MRVVIDTNVFVSSILSPHGAPARLLDLVLSRRVTLLVSPLILEEYQEVLRREEFSFKEKIIADFLRFLQIYAEKIIVSPQKLSLPDAEDEPFLACALQGKADFLITGNKKHFPPSACEPLKPLSPAEFLEALRDRI